MDARAAPASSRQPSVRPLASGQRRSSPGSASTSHSPAASLQRRAGPQCQTRAPRAAVPQRRRALERIHCGGHLQVQRERHRQREQCGADARVRAEGEGFVRRAAAQQCRQREVVQTGQRGADRAAKGKRGHQSRLQHAGGQGRTEQQAAGLPACGTRRAPHRLQNVGGGEQHEEGDQEGLHHRVVRRHIAVQAPGGADGEGEQEAGEHQRAPCALPAQRDDEAVEQQVVTEQHRDLPAAGRRQQGRDEGAGQPEQRQHLRGLACGTDGAGHTQQRKQGESRCGREIAVARQCEEHGQVEQGKAAALQRQAEHALLVLVGSGGQPQPAGNERDSGRHRAGQAQGRRQQPGLCGQPQRRCHAEEQYDHADARQRIAAHHPCPQRGSLASEVVAGLRGPPGDTFAGTVQGVERRRLRAGRGRGRGRDVRHRRGVWRRCIGCSGRCSGGRRRVRSRRRAGVGGYVGARPE